MASVMLSRNRANLHVFISGQAIFRNLYAGQSKTKSQSISIQSFGFSLSMFGNRFVRQLVYKSLKPPNRSSNLLSDSNSDNGQRAKESCSGTDSFEATVKAFSSVSHDGSSLCEKVCVNCGVTIK